MSLLKNILFVHVVLILLLHSFLPHKHHGEMTNMEHDEAHQSASNLIDFLGLSFHQDSHLNLNFIILAYNSDFKKFDAKNNHFLDYFAIPQNAKYYVQRVPFFRTIKETSLIVQIICAHGLRAPPSLIL